MQTHIKGINVEEFIHGYITAMLWSSTDESTPEGGEPFDRNYDENDLTEEARERIEIECRAFIYRTWVHIREENFVGRYDSTIESRAGHDFWLTRAGHGAGFWDGDWKKYDGEVMTKVAKAFGEIHLSVTEDKRVDLE